MAAESWQAAPEGPGRSLISTLIPWEALAQLGLLELRFIEEKDGHPNSLLPWGAPKGRQLALDGFLAIIIMGSLEGQCLSLGQIARVMGEKKQLLEFFLCL
jgi:hypothetical protein